MNPRNFGGELEFLGADAAEITKQRFRKLRESIFKVVPEACFLRGWRTLDIRMFFMLTPEMVGKKIVGQKDICSLCSAEDCPYNRVSHKWARVLKVKILGLVHNR